MKSQLILCSLLAVGVSVSTLGCEQVTPGDNQPTTDAPPTAKPLPAAVRQNLEPQIGTHGVCFGVVSTLGSDWVEIGPGWEGTSDVRKKQAENNKNARRLSVAGTLAGGDPKGFGREFTHRLSDLRVGDVLYIDTFRTRNGSELCMTITIRRRPGGKIPPFPADKLNLGSHLCYQAEQDWEEKGIPIPKQYLDKDGRNPWTKPAYPPVAPMPRKAKSALPAKP